MSLMTIMINADTPTIQERWPSSRTAISLSPKQTELASTSKLLLAFHASDSDAFNYLLLEKGEDN